MLSSTADLIRSSELQQLLHVGLGGTAQLVDDGSAPGSAKLFGHGYPPGVSRVHPCEIRHLTPGLPLQLRVKQPVLRRCQLKGKRSLA